MTDILTSLLIGAVPGLGGGLGLGGISFSESPAQRLNFGFAEEPELTAARALNDAGFEELAQALGTVAQILGGHRKQYQTVLPVHVTSLWRHTKFSTSYLASCQIAAIIGVTPNSGGSH